MTRYMHTIRMLTSSSRKASHFTKIPTFLIIWYYIEFSNVIKRLLVQVRNASLNHALVPAQEDKHSKYSWPEALGMKFS